MTNMWLLLLNLAMGAAGGMLLCRLRYRALGPVRSWLVGALAGAAAGALVYSFLTLMWLFRAPPVAEQIAVSAFLLGGALTGFLLFGKRPA